MYNIHALAARFLVTTALIYPSIGVAQDTIVKLTSSDGTINISGNLMSFQDEFYQIETDLGPLRVSARQVSCDGPACPVVQDIQDIDLTLLGSDGIGRTLVPLLLEGYASEILAEADTRIQSDSTVSDVTLIGNEGYGEAVGTYRVVSRTSQAAFTALTEQTADIGLSSRRISREEARALNESGAGNMISPENEIVVALDSLAMIVHEDNPVSMVSMADLAAIYRGEITNWSALNGPDLAITVLGRETGSAARAEFANSVLDGNEAQSALQLATDVAISTSVSQDPASIGYVSLAFQRQNKALQLVGRCGLRHDPSRFATKTEEYPLVRRLYMYQRGVDLPTQGRDFLTYVQSQGADGVIAKAGYIDLGMERRNQNDQIASQIAYQSNLDDVYLRDLNATYMDEIAHWDRLSITMRFGTGSVRLDAKAERDVARLMSYVSGLQGDVRLAVVGFTDSVGADSANFVLGEQRAAAVSALLNDRIADAGLDVNIAVKSFGELGPVACNDSQQGKANNRRVELWIQN